MKPSSECGVVVESEATRSVVYFVYNSDSSKELGLEEVRDGWIM